MIHFQFSLLLGNYFYEIKSQLDHFESFYLGLFISDLTYESKKEGINKKKQYYEKSSTVIRDINKKIRHFNSIVKKLNSDLTLLKEIDLISVKKVIDEHKGDYPKATGSSSFTDEILGKGDSPSVLARKHTALLIRNILMNTKLSMSDFGKSVTNFVKPFECINREKMRKGTVSEIDKIEAIYSIGGLAEAIFVLGRLLENIINQYLLLLKKCKLIAKTYNFIKSEKFSFENKIDYLYSRKFITPSKFSKMKSVKWDRNLYGHSNRVKPKDAYAMIIIGLQGIEYLDYKIQKLKNVQIHT
ncbi:MAG: hypothetical protein PVF17_10790 [Ignavibacteria bacterium]|jgi:hypothetical protein